MLFYWVTYKASLANRMVIEYFHRKCILWARVAIMVNTLYMYHIWQEQVHPQMNLFSLQKSRLLLRVEITHLWLQHISWAPNMNGIRLSTGEIAASQKSKSTFSQSLDLWHAMEGLAEREKSEGKIWRNCEIEPCLREDHVRKCSMAIMNWTCEEKGGHPGPRGVNSIQRSRTQV